MQWYPEQGSLWCTAALSNLHLICMLFVWGPAQPSLVAQHMVTSQGRAGHILYTPHGHTDSRSPGGTAGRVRSSTTKKGVSHGHSAVRGKEMTSYRLLLVLAIMRCGVYAEVGRGQVLVPVQWRFCVGLVYSDPTSIFRHFMHNILSAH